MKENVLATQKMLGVMATMIALFLAVVDGATVSTVLPAIRAARCCRLSVVNLTSRLSTHG